MKKIIFAAYGLLLLSFVLFSYAFVDPNLFYLKKVYSGFAFQNRATTTTLYIVFILLLFFFYFIFLGLRKKKILNPRHIKSLIGITIVTLLFSYPAMLSHDIFNYIATAKALFFYHENPYIIMPIEFLGEPFLAFTRAANKIALYGPVWILLTGIPLLLSFGNFLLNILNLKLLVGAFYLSAVFLIWKISKNWLSVILFAFNPLVVIEILVSGHNDIAMMFLVLLAFYLLKKRQIILSILALFISILIKYTTIFLLPIFLYTTYKISQNKKIDWTKVYMTGTLAMFAVFLTAPLREEIYPWYVTWMLSLAVLVPQKKFLVFFLLALSFGALLRYVPVFYTGSYFGRTPIIKELVTIIPVILITMAWLWKRRA